MEPEGTAEEIGDPAECLVLLGFAEAMSAPEVVWSLVDRGYRVAAFARRGRRSALRSSREVTCYEITPPDVDANAALRELERLCQKNEGGSRVALFPLDDSALWLASRMTTRPGLTLVGASPAAIELALDKAAQLTAAQTAGFNVPPTTICTSGIQVREAAKSFPVIIKPAKAAWEEEGRLRKGGMWVCGNKDELEAAIAKWAERMPAILQPFISGVGEGIFGLATKAGVEAWSAHRRLRMMNPQGSGSSACVSQPVDEEIRKVAEHFVRAAGWEGLFMIELLRDQSGKVWFVEFNGRAWGSMALARRQGLEYPAWQVDLAVTGQTRISNPPQTRPSLICKNLGREFMHVLFVLRGPKSSAIQPWPSFWKSLRDVLRVRKGDGLYNWRRSDPKVLFIDFYNTVLDNAFKPRRVKSC
jgi:biotin carboxylase